MNELIVMGRAVRIKVVSHKEVEIRSKAQGTLGLFVGHENTIYLSRTLDDEAKKRVLLHELFHAHLHISGIENFLTDESEEAICDVSENFLELFRNEDFIKFLGKKGGF